MTRSVSVTVVLAEETPVAQLQQFCESRPGAADNPRRRAARRSARTKPPTASRGEDSLIQQSFRAARRGAPVRVRGVDVGQVREIHLSSRGKAEVTLRVSIDV